MSFSLGVVLYELATGQHPFRGSTTRGHLRSHSQLRPDSADLAQSRLPVELEETLTRHWRRTVSCAASRPRAARRPETIAAQEQWGILGQAFRRGRGARVLALSRAARGAARDGTAAGPPTQRDRRTGCSVSGLEPRRVLLGLLPHQQRNRDARHCLGGVWCCLAAAGFAAWRFWPRAVLTSISLSQITNTERWKTLLSPAMEIPGRGRERCRPAHFLDTEYCDQYRYADLAAVPSDYVGLSFSPDATTSTSCEARPRTQPYVLFS